MSDHGPDDFTTSMGLLYVGMVGLDLWFIYSISKVQLVA